MTALKFQAAFDVMVEVDKPYEVYFAEKENNVKRMGPPGPEDWESTKRIVKFFKIFMNHQQVQSQHRQNPNFLLPLSAYPLHQEHHHHHIHLLQPQPKRHNSSGSLDLSSPYIPKLPFSDPRHEFLLRNHQQQMSFSSKCVFSSSTSSTKKFDGSSKTEGFRSGE